MSVPLSTLQAIRDDIIEADVLISHASLEATSDSAAQTFAQLAIARALLALARRSMAEHEVAP